MLIKKNRHTEKERKKLEKKRKTDKAFLSSDLFKWVSAHFRDFVAVSDSQSVVVFFLLVIVKEKNTIMIRDEYELCQHLKLPTF